MQTTQKQRAPFFVMPETMSDMTDDALITLLEQVRERRLHYVRMYQEKEKMKQEAKTDKVRARVEKHFTMLAKEIGQLEKLIEKLDKRITNIRALRVELDMEIAIDES